MATARVSFTSAPSIDSGRPEPPKRREFVYERLPLAMEHKPTTAELRELKAILEDATHLVVASERLTVVEEVLAGDRYSQICLGSLDETPQSPRNVIVKRIRKFEGLASKTLKIAKFVQVWKDLKHPNVLHLLGFTLKHENQIDRLIFPHLINGNIRDFLNQAPVEVAQRLGFVRDVTSGLDYLHSQSLPVCHGNLDPRHILIDENFNAVLINWGPPNIASTSLVRYDGPEVFLSETSGPKEAKDVWSWACVAFEILTDIRPFHERETWFQIYSSIIQHEVPGPLDQILDLVPNAPKPGYASTLRLLHSYLPLCWDYEARNRPHISLLRRQVFMFSFEDDADDSVVATLEDLAHLLIPPDRLRIVECSELGAGNYGEVFLGTLDEASPTPRDVAVKRLKAVGTRGERVRLAKRLARELNIWAKIKHPNVVELIGYYLDEKYESPLLISALMTNGNVLDYIERYEPDIERRIAFVKGITAGLACLHNFDPAICHADLKPANVLIDLQMNAVLCDFGLASFVSGSGDLPGLITTTSIKGTPRYMSPELLLDSDCKHNLESDVWAWGCTVFQVLTGRIPYAKITGDVQFYLAVNQGEIPGDVALLLPADAEVVDSKPALTMRFLSPILTQCWDFDPQKRPSICTLLSDLSNASPQTGAEANWSKDVPSGDTQAQQVLPHPSSRRRTLFNVNADVAYGGLEERMKLAKISEDPPGTYADVESAQEDKQTVPDEAQPEGDGANEENSRTGQDASTINWDADREAQFGEDDKTVIPKAAERKISIRPLSALIWATVLILSLSANIVLLLRKGDPLPLRYQAVTRATYPERDL